MNSSTLATSISLHVLDDIINTASLKPPTALGDCAGRSSLWPRTPCLVLSCCRQHARLPVTQGHRHFSKSRYLAMVSCSASAIFCPGHRSRLSLQQFLPPATTMLKRGRLSMAHLQAKAPVPHALAGTTTWRRRAIDQVVKPGAGCHVFLTRRPWGRGAIIEQPWDLVAWPTIAESVAISSVDTLNHAAAEESR